MLLFIVKIYGAIYVYYGILRKFKLKCDNKNKKVKHSKIVIS